MLIHCVCNTDYDFSTRSAAIENVVLPLIFSCNGSRIEIIFLASALHLLEDGADHVLIVRRLLVFLFWRALVSAVVAAAKVVTVSLAHHKSLIGLTYLLRILRHHHKSALDLRSVLSGIPLVGVIWALPCLTPMEELLRLLLDHRALHDSPVFHLWYGCAVPGFLSRRNVSISWRGRASRLGAMPVVHDLLSHHLVLLPLVCRKVIARFPCLVSPESLHSADILTDLS